MGSLDRPTSLTLLERVRDKDEEAWRRLLHLYGPLVERWCARGGVHPADADDVCQDVFQAVAAGLDGFRRDRPGDTFRGWLRTIAHNKVQDHFRRQGREPRGAGGSDAQARLAQVPGPEAASDSGAEPEERGLFLRALGLIRGDFEERTWQAFWRAAVEGQSPAVIAADLGVTPAAVRKAKSRVLHRLREEVGDLIA